MLSEEMIQNVGVFNPKTIQTFIQKVRNTDRVSEMENMTLVSIISTHLLYQQFIDKKYEELTPGILLKSRIINDE